MGEAADKLGTDCLLRVDGLQAAYPDGTTALRGVNLSLRPGEKVALLGANGSGKTSLLLAIMGGLRPAGGRIVFDGVELSGRTVQAIRRRCGMVFQQSDDQLFMPTLLEDAAFGPLNHGEPPERAAELARAALAEVGLEGLEHRSGHHLSEGQKRAACLATVLSMRVELLLLDEPTVDLDARARARIVHLLRGRGETLLLATHDLEAAGALCTRAVILSDGAVAAEGPCAEVLADTALLERHGLRCAL